MQRNKYSVSLRECARWIYYTSRQLCSQQELTPKSYFLSYLWPITKIKNKQTSFWSKEERCYCEEKKDRSFFFRRRFAYLYFFRNSQLTDFITSQDDCIVSLARTYRHSTVKDLVVTLIPVRHFAHPEFYHQIDALCRQHESVLVEGRTPLKSAPYSTFVPPRRYVHGSIRPLEHEDDEGWEPNELSAFYQPFSWGVIEGEEHNCQGINTNNEEINEQEQSKDDTKFKSNNISKYTVLHAADKYDYEMLPWWCSLRFNVPVIGSLQREKHCMSLIYPLYKSGYKSFAIPWGAAHMPLLHQMLVDNNFEFESFCSLIVFRKVDGIVSQGEYTAINRQLSLYTNAKNIMLFLAM